MAVSWLRTARPTSSGHPRALVLRSLGIAAKTGGASRRCTSPWRTWHGGMLGMTLAGMCVCPGCRFRPRGDCLDRLK